MQARRRYFTSPRWNWRRGRSKVLSTRTRSATSRKPLHSHKVILSHTAAWPQFTDAPARFQEPTKKNKELPSSAKRSEEHTSELQSRLHLVCRLLLEKKKK